MAGDGDSASALRAAAEAQKNEIDAEVKSRPLVGPRLAGLESLQVELAATPAFACKVAAMADKYSGLRRVRGDGNCFFRGFTFRLLEILLEDEAERERVLGVVKGALAYLEQVGYEAVSIETFTEYAEETLAGLGAKSLADLEALFGDEGESDYLVWFSRLVCAGYLKHNAERFLPFLAGTYSTVEEFCAKEVEPMGKESEQLQIIALCEYLGVKVSVEYLDSSQGDATVTHDFGPSSGGAGATIALLYRPSHYDVLYR